MSPRVALAAGVSLGVVLLVVALATLSPASKPPQPSASTPTPATSPTATDPKKEAPPYRGLDAALFMQSSAEYRACCVQAFNLATEKVRSKVALKSGKGKPPAVILDLDETVLDNGVFQAEQLRTGLAYDQARWDKWEETGGADVRLIPGAKEFLSFLKQTKVEVVYITNRNDKFKKQTMAVLDREGIAVPNEQLMCADKETGSNKDSRRALAAKQFDIILLVGDNLRDFDDKPFKYDAKGNDADGRKKAVDDRAAKFGTDWIILPNPCYGEWNKAAGKGTKDTDLLHRPSAN